MSYERVRGQDEIDAMSPAERRAYDEAQARLVFGASYERDKYGNPIETGIGSAKQQTAQHRAAQAREAERLRMNAAIDRAAAERSQG